MSCERGLPGVRRRLGPLLGACGMGLALVLAACGHKGDPLPPQRFVPATANDLVVRQQGELLTFRVAYPQTTTSGEVLPGLERVELWSLELPGAGPEQPATVPEVDPIAFARGAARLVSLTGPELESSVAGDRLEIRLPLSEVGPESGAAEVFAIKTVSSTGEASDFSNLAVLFPTTAVPPPTALQLRARADGVEVEWRAPDGAEGFHVYRRVSTLRTYGEPLARVTAEERSYVDATARFGERYIFTVRAIASSDPLVESDAAIETELVYRDTFAPAPPPSFLALPEPGQVRLVLEPSPAEDAVGYHVYRQDLGADFRRVTVEPVSDPEYLDRGLVSGQSYIYRITAIDNAGNEGPPGAEVAVVLP